MLGLGSGLGLVIESPKVRMSIIIKYIDPLKRKRKEKKDAPHFCRAARFDHDHTQTRSFQSEQAVVEAWLEELEGHD